MRCTGPVPDGNTRTMTEDRNPAWPARVRSTIDARPTRLRRRPLQFGDGLGQLEHPAAQLRIGNFEIVPPQLERLAIHDRRARMDGYGLILDGGSIGFRALGRLGRN